MKRKFESELKPLSRGGIPAAVADVKRDSNRKWFKERAAVPLLPCTSEENEAHQTRANRVSLVEAMVAIPVPKTRWDEEACKKAIKNEWDGLTDPERPVFDMNVVKE